jgi:hypothetical protein
VEPEAVISPLLVDRNVIPISMHYRECIKCNKDIEAKLEKGYFKQFWIAYQRRKTVDVTSSRIRKFNHVMLTWIEKAMKSGTQIFIIGITGKHWSDTPYQQLVQDKILFQSTHRMCHYNYKMDKTLKEPSNVCFKLISNMEIQSHGCKCNLPFKDHSSDWNIIGSEGNSRPKNQATSFICNELLKEFQFGRLPDSSLLQIERTESSKTQLAYPTEQREEWKRKQKEMKAAGKEPKKRTKIVEEHYDDCGTDLSSLGPSDPSDFLLCEPAEIDTDSDEDIDQ